MADARLRGAWLGKMRFDDLSDTAWRVFTSALMWSVEQGTDGVIPSRYLKQLHPDGEQPSAIDDLVTAGIAERTDKGLELIDWAGELGQSTAAQVEEYKRNARERQRRRRGRLTEVTSEGAGVGDRSAGRDDFAPRDVTRDIPRDVGPGPGKGSRKEESRSCAKHPGGTDEPCGPCRDARLRFDAKAEADKQRATVSGIVTQPDCPKHPNYPHPSLPHGCPRCAEEAAA